ncbi:MAG: flagellar biosynthesis protein FlhA [Parvularculaceae bacterium]|nr:flagellar biosynthesis protein FlhA [Parvularculaceae bacterium]
MTAKPAARSAGAALESFFPAESRATTVMTAGLIAIIAMMVLPAPPVLVDIGLTVSFALAMLVFAMTLFVQRPVDFSGFPTILLAAVMLRLSLNISSTRLIIGEGHTGPDAAGAVIHGFAMFIMDGNIFIGLVVFIVIMIVNFMVITKGAGRMAEVGARFALDGMPGKQLAIDSDVAAGAITHEEAQARRKREQDETAFFGSLDGASKFVKGDAVAGLLITTLNIVVGIGIGVGVHGLSLEEAVKTYSILTVGDGLVSQLPAVIISVASALLMSKGGTSGSTDAVVIGQLTSYPLALMTVAGCMAVFAIVPGLPFLYFAAGAIALAAGALLLHGRESKRAREALTALPPAPSAAGKTLGDHLALDEIQVEFAPDLTPLALDAATGLETRIAKIRNFVAAEFGFVVPPIRLTDSIDLSPGDYVIYIQGVEHARFRLKPDQILVLADETDPASLGGEPVQEPVYGAPARWVPAARRQDALAAGYAVVEPGEVLATHLLESIKSNFGRLMTRRAMRRLLDEAVKTTDQGRSDALRQMINDLVPDKVPLETAQAVFRLLLDEGVSVRNVGLILETIAEVRPWCENAEQIAEHVRRRLAKQITASLRNDRGEAPLIQLSPEWEQLFLKHEVVKSATAKEVALPPEEFNRLSRSIQDQLRSAAAQKISPAIVTFADRRRFIRAVLNSKGIRNPVVAYDELDLQTKPVLVGAA